MNTNITLRKICLKERGAGGGIRQEKRMSLHLRM